MKVIQKVEDRLKTEEGFRSKPYSDSQGVLTIGYGTNIAEGITVKEAEWLLRNRLADTEGDLARRWAPYGEMPIGVRAALLNMAYQIGVTGLLEFHDMIAALRRQDWKAARTAARDSDWHRETPERAEAVIAGIR